MRKIRRCGKARKYAKHPRETAGLITRLFYSWATDLIYLGNERQLDSSDLWPLQPENTCNVVSQAFEPKYNESKSIVNATLSVFGFRVIYIGILRLAAMLECLYGPVVLQQVVSSIESKTAEFQTLLTPILLLVVVKVAQAILQTQSDLENQIMYVQVTSALQNLLYKKI
ncbi:hypothetical protein AC1031_018977 [Aphanomyces cochlioides]|nr:hypothetical protein AC1031_018977 [Aphanomyces cochlioides]